jgi:uncharacterized glyoxalase superfamily protein PhnB
MTPTPSITVKRNCRKAMAAFAEIFGGVVTMMATGAELSGIPIPEDKADRGHARRAGT